MLVSQAPEGADSRAAANGSGRRTEDGFSALARLAAAREAQRAWAATPMGVRLAAVRRLRRLIAANAVQLGKAVQSSRSNPLAEALAGEVLPLADACRFLERDAARLLRPRRLGFSRRPLWLAGVASEVRREPHGTVLIVGPSNYPLLLMAVQTIQALVAGNSVLLKPGRDAGLAARVFTALCQQAGFSPPLVQVLSESPEAAWEAIEAGVDKVVLTGSASTGVDVLSVLAPRLIPATLELSGSDAAFVQSDADLDLVARALCFGVTWNGGATCIAPRRAFVPDQLIGPLEARLLCVLAKLPTDARHWTLGESTQALVSDALSRGARRLFPRHAGEHGPTILADAAVTMPLLREDVLGPVLSLVPVSSESAALKAAEQSPYALGATVFGEERHARKLAGRIRAGVVVINDVIVPTADPRLPFGGRGLSGFGVTRGAEGLLEMTVTKVIAVRRGRSHWHLVEPRLTDQQLVRCYIEAVHGAVWTERCGAGLRLLRNLVCKRLVGNDAVEHVG